MTAKRNPALAAMSRSASYDPNSSAGTTAYWNDESFGEPTPQAPVRKRVAAQMEPVDIDQMMRDAIARKIVYSQALGTPDPAMVNMMNLNRLGIQAGKGRGLPYGVAPENLTMEEKQWMIDTAMRMGRGR